MNDESSVIERILGPSVDLAEVISFGDGWGVAISHVRPSRSEFYQRVWRNAEGAEAGLLVDHARGHAAIRFVEADTQAVSESFLARFATDDLDSLMARADSDDALVRVQALLAMIRIGLADGGPDPRIVARISHAFTDPSLAVRVAMLHSAPMLRWEPLRACIEALYADPDLAEGARSMMRQWDVFADS